MTEAAIAPSKETNVHLQRIAYLTLIREQVQRNEPAASPILMSIESELAEALKCATQQHQQQSAPPPIVELTTEAESPPVEAVPSDTTTTTTEKTKEPTVVVDVAAEMRVELVAQRAALQELTSRFDELTKLQQKTHKDLLTTKRQFVALTAAMQHSAATTSVDEVAPVAQPTLTKQPSQQQQQTLPPRSVLSTSNNLVADYVAAVSTKGATTAMYVDPNNKARVVIKRA